MPISDKEISQLLYEQLPSVYHNEDAKAKPTPYPLKRFLQVASVGLEQVESEIDDLQLLFNPDLTPAKYLDPLGRMLGFTFPKFCTEADKRALLKNLPLLYKLKGSDLIFQMLARLIFEPDARTDVHWEYTLPSVKLAIELEVSDYVPNILEKTQIYSELVEFFRPINVELEFELLVYYQEELIADFRVTFEFDVLYIDDNFLGQHEYTGGANVKPRVLNKMILNQTAELYDALYEYYDLNKAIDHVIDSITTVETEEETFEKLRKYLSENVFINNISSINGSALLSNSSGELMDDSHYDSTHSLHTEEASHNHSYTETAIVSINDSIVSEMDSTNDGNTNSFLIGADVPEEYVHENWDVENIADVYTEDSEDDTYPHQLTLNRSLLNDSEVLGDKFREEERGIDRIQCISKEEFDHEEMEDSSSSSVLIDLNYSLNFAILNSTMVLSKNHPVIMYNY